MKRYLFSIVMLMMACVVHAGMLVTTSADNVWNLHVTTIDTTYLSRPESAVIVSVHQVQEYVKNPDNVTSTLHMYRHLPSSGLTVPSKVKVKVGNQEFEIPVTGLGGSAFAEHNGIEVNNIKNDVLVSAVIPDSVRTIGGGMFSKCYSLRSVVFPSSVESIGTASMFYDCRSLESVSLPLGTKSIGFEMFHGCTNLMSVELPEGLETICMDAFNGCSSLMKIMIPKTVTKVEPNAFRGLPSGCTLYVPRIKFWTDRVKDGMYEGLPVSYCTGSCVATWDEVDKSTTFGAIASLKAEDAEALTNSGVSPVSLAAWAKTVGGISVDQESTINLNAFLMNAPNDVTDLEIDNEMLPSIFSGNENADVFKTRFPNAKVEIVEVNEGALKSGPNEKFYRLKLSLPTQN